LLKTSVNFLEARKAKVNSVEEENSWPCLCYCTETLHYFSLLPILLGYIFKENEGQGTWHAWEGSEILIYQISVRKPEGTISYAEGAQSWHVS